MANVHFSSVFNFVLIIANQKGMSYHHWIEAFHKDFPTHYMFTRELSHTKINKCAIQCTYLITRRVIGLHVNCCREYTHY